MNALVRTLFATAALSLAAAGGSAQAIAANMDQTQPKAGEEGPPKTVGAMQNEVGNKAASPEDVKRQTEGRPTTAQSAKKGDNATHPGMTNSPPGTVGAAPGANPETTRK